MPETYEGRVRSNRSNKAENEGNRGNESEQWRWGVRLRGRLRSREKCEACEYEIGNGTT